MNLINSIWKNNHLEMKSTPKLCIIIPMAFSVVLNCCVTCWIVLHFKSSSYSIHIRMKLNQDLIAWRDMAWRNWITTIHSNDGWCSWSTVINDQRIPAKKLRWLFFSFDNNKIVSTYPQLECASTSKDRKLISIVCPICAWISQIKSRWLS